MHAISVVRMILNLETVKLENLFNKILEAVFGQSVTANMACHEYDMQKIMNRLLCL